MDINDLRSVFSVIMFVMLAGIYIWAWSKNRKKDFEQAANLPFSEPEQPAPIMNVDDKNTNDINAVKVEKNNGDKT